MVVSQSVGRARPSNQKPKVRTGSYYSHYAGSLFWGSGGQRVGMYAYD